MAEPESEHHVERKVVYETTSATSTGNSTAAWIIIGIVAIALLAFIIVKMT
jgi:hypothetical protein